MIGKQLDVEHDAAPDALIERVVASTIGLFDLAGMYLGHRLGLYRALRDGGPATSHDLARRTGTDERYAREWLEHQAVTGLLTVDDNTSATKRRYALPLGHAEALVDADSPSYIAPLARQALGMLRPLPQLLEAFRTGEGVPYRDYEDDTRDGIAELNRAMFINQLGTNWFPAITDAHARLDSPPGARVADMGCGTGWSSIAIARAYRHAFVDGFDADATSIEAATVNAAAEGLEDRVRFFVRDVSDPVVDGVYDVVTIFEALHDMARPVEALATARRLLARGGTTIVAGERVAERFTAPGDDLERLMYGFSVVHCLAVGRADHHDSAATGAVIRRDTVRAYGFAAGFRRVETLPIDNDFRRFYRLDSVNRRDADVGDRSGRRGAREERAPRVERPAGLTEREAEVVGMLARGLQTKQVARALGISAKTADRHIQNAYRKIGVSSRAAATLFAMEHGLLAWGELPIGRPAVHP